MIAHSPDKIETIDPATGQHLKSYGLHAASEIEARVAAAHTAFASWGESDVERRGALLRNLAAELRKQKPELARLATVEMGKPIGESEGEVEKCAWACEYYADQAGQQLAPQAVASSATSSDIAFRPLGTVLAIMPWNFPFFQVIRFAAPTIAAGNTVLLKHAANVTGCGLALERLFTQAGFPAGVFGALLVRGAQSHDVIEDARVAAVTLTGSEPAGSAVAATAGRVLKKTVLELGGSDAYIVLRDADIELAAKTAVRARFQNTGQSCIAAKRFIVEAPIYDRFLAAFVTETRKLRLGNPLEKETTIGPLARHDLREDIARQVDESRAMGADIVQGGRKVDGGGAFYEPTIVANVTVDMPMFAEETFGPAAAVVRAADADDAVGLANATRFGLGNNVWTADVELGQRIAERLQSGLVFVNGMTASDPRLPFGGVKKSGYGRELSYFGLREFTNVQTVWVGPAQ